MTRNAVFLDRDGIINRKAPDGEYIRSWAEFEFVPGVFEALTRLSGAGFVLFIVTNQRGLALGRLSADDLSDMHDRLLERLRGSSVQIMGIYVCPHDFIDNCPCRKPRPGMLLEAARTHKIDLRRSWMVGDNQSDIEAGKQAGCRTAFMTQKLSSRSTDADIVADNWDSLAAAILRFRQ